MNRDEAVAALIHLEGIEDFVVNPGEVRCEFVQEVGVTLLSVAGETYGMTVRSFSMINSLVGIPSPYARKCPITLLIPHLNYWLTRVARPINIMLRGGGDKTAVGFTKATIASFSPVGVLERIEDSVGRVGSLDYRVRSSTLDYVDIIVMGEKAFDLKPGDAVQAGVRFAGSIVGKVAPSIQAYTERLVCVNGLISVDNALTWSRRTPIGHFGEWISVCSERAWQAADHEFTVLANSVEVGVNAHVAELLQSVYQSYSIPLWARELITARALSVPMESVFDLVQAISWVATNIPEVADNARLAARLMVVAGSVVSHPERCEACHRLLA